MSTEKGKVKVIMDEQVISDKFRKKEFVIETIGDYPQEVIFQTANDKCDMLNAIAVGQEVEVHYNLRGRSWTSPQGEVKYFNTLDAWKLESIGGEVTQPALESAANTDLPF